MLLNLLNLVFMAFVFIAVLNTGALVLKALKFEAASSAQRAVLSFGAGSVIFSLLILFTGKVLVLNRVSMLVLPVLLFLVSVAEFQKTMAFFRELFVFLFKRKKPFILTVFLLMTARLGFHFFEIFLPPTAWDTLAYHYAIPELYKTAGRIIYIPFMYHSNWPQGIEMFFAMGLTAFNGYTANGMSYMFSLMLVIAAYLIGKKLKDEDTGILTAALTAALTVFKTQAVNGQVENGLAFYEVAALYCLLLWAQKKDMKLIVLSGILAGAAASVKILGGFVILALPLLALTADIIYGEKKRKLYFKEAFVLGATAALVCCVWYIKSWVEAGNPVWPFAYGIFGGKNWSMDLALYRDEYYKAHGAGIGLWQFIKLPYTLIFSGNMDGYVGNNILLYLALAPFMLSMLVKKETRDGGFIFSFFAAFVVFWFLSAQFVRFMLPALVVLTALNCAVVLKILNNKESQIARKLMQFLVLVFVIFLMLYSFPARRVEDLAGIKSFAAKLDAKAYLTSQQDSYALMDRINYDKNISGKIMLYREVRGYYLQKEYMWGDPANQGLISYKSPDYTAAKMKENAVKYVLVNDNIYKNPGADGYTQTVYDVMAEILKHKAKLLYCENGSCLYEMILSENPSF